MRRHFSLATVLAALALFVSLSGTAAAAIIISSNHQVGAHVIAGANAPSGDTKNLIAGSVGGSDLHASAVSGSTVLDGSLTGADLANGSVGFRKLMLPRISWSGADTDAFDQAPHHTTLSVDGVTLGVSCTLAGPPQTSELHLFVASSAGGTMTGVFSQGPPNTAVISTQTVQDSVASAPVEFASVESSSGTLVIDATFTYHDASRVISFALSGSVTFNTGCDLYGTAVPTPN